MGPKGYPTHYILELASSIQCLLALRWHCAGTTRWHRLKTRGGVARDQPRKSTNCARCNSGKISTRQHGSVPFLGVADPI